MRLACDPRHRLPFPYGFRAAEARALWQQVHAPTLCVDAAYGLSGHSVDSDTMSARRACFRRLTHRVLADCGHMLHVQAPEAIAAAIIDFLTHAMTDTSHN